MAKNEKAVRPWAALCEYPERKPFYLGTIVLPNEAKQHEIDAALLKLWGEISPHPAPKMQAKPGAVFFVAEKDL